MNAIWQVLLALLAAVGLLALGWLTFGRLLTPVGGGGGGPVYAVVPASGDGAHLEHRFFKGNLTQFGKVKSVSIQISSVRIIQCILNWKPHIRCSKLCNDPSIFKFHHGMYHTLWLYNNLDLIQAHIKQPSGLHHFKAFIHQCRRIHGNLLSHHPVRVFQSIFQRH